MVEIERRLALRTVRLTRFIRRGIIRIRHCRGIKEGYRLDICVVHGDVLVEQRIQLVLQLIPQSSLIQIFDDTSPKDKESFLMNKSRNGKN